MCWPYDDRGGQTQVRAQPMLPTSRTRSTKGVAIKSAGSNVPFQSLESLNTRMHAERLSSCTCSRIAIFTRGTKSQR